MDFRRSEDEQAVSALAREILEAQVTPERFAALARAGESFDRETWHALAAANLLGIAIPEEWGGTALDFFAVCGFLQELGHTLPCVPALETLAVALAIEKFGTPSQKENFLSAVCDGSQILTAALIDDFAASADASSTGLHAMRTQDGWRVRGERTCVPYAQYATCILTPVRTETGMILVLLDPTLPGVEMEALRSSSSEPWSHLVLHDLQVLDTDCLGTSQTSEMILRWFLERFTIAQCAKHLGVVERALGLTAKYTSERKQFGRPLATFQAVAQRAADAFILTEAMRLTCWEAASLLVADRECSRAVQVAKYWACEAGAFVTYAAQHLHGGIGVALDYPLHRYYLWSRQLELSLGSAPEQLAKIGSSLAEASDTEMFQSS